MTTAQENANVKVNNFQTTKDQLVIENNMSYITLNS